LIVQVRSVENEVGSMSVTTGGGAACSFPSQPSPSRVHGCMEEQPQQQPLLVAAGSQALRHNKLIDCTLSALFRVDFPAATNRRRRRRRCCLDCGELDLGLLQGAVVATGWRGARAGHDVCGHGEAH